MAHNPLKDEKKKYSFEEWREEVNKAMREYREEFLVTDEPNEFHCKPHTFSDWMNSFIRFMSW